MLTPFSPLAVVEQVPLPPFPPISGCDPLGEISEWQAIESAPAKYHNTERCELARACSTLLSFVLKIDDCAAHCSLTTAYSRCCLLQTLWFTKTLQVPYKDLESAIGLIYPSLFAPNPSQSNQWGNCKIGVPVSPKGHRSVSCT